MKFVATVVFLGAIATMLFGLRQTTAAAGRLVSAPAILTDGVGPGRSLAGIVVRQVKDGADVDLGTFNRALVLVFDPDCGPCHLNMANWIDLLVTSRTYDVPVIAVSLERGNNPDLYWSPLGKPVPTFTADSIAIVAMGVTATPTTILLDAGTVAAEVVGVLNEREKTYLTDLLRENLDLDILSNRQHGGYRELLFKGGHL